MGGALLCAGLGLRQPTADRPRFEGGGRHTQVRITLTLHRGADALPQDVDDAVDLLGGDDALTPTCWSPLSRRGERGRG